MSPRSLTSTGVILWVLTLWSTERSNKCDHRKGQNEIDDKDIVEYFLARLVWEHLDFDKTKSPTEVRGNDHYENDTGYD
jgi:hypothetical protein